MPYETTLSPFRVDILDAAGTVIGEGPLTNVLRLATTDRLDAIGEASFALPAEDPRAALIGAGKQFDLYVADDPNAGGRYLGRYHYRRKELSEAGDRTALVVHVWDDLRELATFKTVGFRRTYSSQDVATVVANLVSVVAGWSAVVDAGIGNTSVTYEGESPLRAIDVLRDRWNKHYRKGTATKQLEFGAFGTASGVRLIDARGQEQARLLLNTSLALVESIRLVEEADEIFNCIIPLGAGQGVSQLTIQQATAGSYTVQTGTNADGSSFYYIKDAASVTAYGERWKVLSFPNIRPISNSDANQVNAANALKLTAEAYIARHLTPRVTYEVSVTGLRRAIKPGDTVRLQYRGVAEGYGYIDVDQDFYVMDLTIDRQVSGKQSARLAIATLAERRTSDTDLVLEVIHDIRALKIHVPITMAYAPIGPHIKRMNSANPATFVARIKSEVLYLNRALLRFKTTPLKSSVTGAASGGGATSSAAGSHRHKMFHYLNTYAWWQPTNIDLFQCKNSADGLTSQFLEIRAGNLGNELYTEDASGDHDHTVPNHTHPLTYGLFADTNYPQTISLWIDGIDRTVALGGPWALSNAGVDIEVDVTTYLVNAAGGLRQNHTLEFRCTSGQGEIEAEVDMLVSIQPIAVS